MKRIEGFPAIENQHARVLVLGSMPSVVSLEKQQYYGHGRNAFWPIMTRLLGIPEGCDYQQKKQILIQHKIAVWDVLQSCRRQGSLDADIESDSIIINDFEAFFRTHSSIKNICFNGRMAEKTYKKYVPGKIVGQLPALQYHCFPSTSPAYASLSLAEKTQCWRAILGMIAV